MARILGTHKLLQPIILTTRPQGSDEEKETELKPAGFCVVVTRPKVKDLKVFDDHEGKVGGIVGLLKRVSNLDDIEVENLDGDDFEQLGNLLDGKLPSGSDGGTSSGA